MKKDTYQIITDRVIELLEQGVVPWRKPWKGDAEAPKNLISKKCYQGMNLFLLNCTQHSSNYFLTWNQAKNLGGHVKKDVHGYPVVFWKFLDVEDKEGETKKVPFLRYYTVFNIEQCEGIEIPKSEDNTQIDFEPIAEAESIVKNYNNRPEIRHKKQSAHYSPSKDYVNMPVPDSFSSTEYYYSVLFHELVHSTGHESRLDREGINDFHFFGDSVYSKEELVAEFGATFLCSKVAIKTTFDNSVSYIDGWIRRLRNNNKILISASGKAQKAVDFMLGV